MIRRSPYERRVAFIDSSAYFALKDFSLTDATSFALMERLGVRFAFTFDRNFAQYGLTALAPEHLAPETGS